MPEVVHTATVNAPVERIFAFIEQAENNVDWVPDLLSSERLTPGATRVGTRFRFVSRLPGVPVPIDVTDEVAEYEPNRIIRFVGRSGPPHSGYWQFEAQPPEDGASRTRVTYAMQFELPPGIGALVSRMINLPERMRQQAKACLQNLRNHVE